MNLGVIGYGDRIRWVLDEMIKVDPACSVTSRLNKSLGKKKVIKSCFSTRLKQ
ncbi:hypothetical protein J2Z66_002427 [Paenibacillus eucommiae]|uniref:Gfo/Idh/MocA-like oxidoreductase N-terminal domain-containing protein n=1 Tax=Paenibacillus eucommiae TaxID=1355755 RepID=A0ABS4IVF7_9BACL|nr:hypothetical protein [Paenibacillus eucommiae]